MAAQLNAAYIARGKDYQARIANLLANGQPVFINQLILQDSPCLIQQAHNPVILIALGRGRRYGQLHVCHDKHCLMLETLSLGAVRPIN